MHKRIKEFLDLKENWFSPGEGDPFFKEDLFLASNLALELESLGFKPYIYPHPENEISLEFDEFKPNMPSITLKFPTQEVVLHNYNLETKVGTQQKAKITDLNLIILWLNNLTKEKA